MNVLIGHASMDEQGGAAGGRAGDQTGKELCTRDWYTKGWNVLLRPVRADLAEKSAQAMEAACRNELIGYDQSGRNTLYEKAKAVNFCSKRLKKPVSATAPVWFMSALSQAVQILHMRATAIRPVPWSGRSSTAEITSS